MRIVVIEDEKPIREGLVRILNKINSDYHVVNSAENGKEGLEKIEQERPDLIFLDIQMPDMDGLEMLKRVREQKISVKVVILTAYSDFEYAREAISLGIENYLLKPVNLQELRKTMEKIQGELLVEQRGRQTLTLEQMLTDALEGKFHESSELQRILEQNYQITGKEPMYCLYALLEEKEEKKEAENFLRELQLHCDKMKLRWILRRNERALLICFYRIEEPDKLIHYLKRSVIPAFLARVKKHVIFTGKAITGLQGLNNIEKELYEKCKWNLVLGEGILIECEKVDAFKTYRFVYPAETENRARHAVVQLDSSEFMKCFQQFMQCCVLEVHRPKEIQEVCIRFAYAVINTAKECGTLKDEELMVQNVLKKILEAVSWDEIMKVMLELFSKIQIEKETEASASEILVKRALSIVKESYSEGINLEETARRLHVSEEYLGKQLKKETGLSFTEIIRKYRVDQVKRLLLDTELKLNQIAAMTGFSDPKYMSKVFRAEVGMLPNEYRRMNS